jgi:hypothetical protein
MITAINCIETKKPIRNHVAARSARNSHKNHINLMLLRTLDWCQEEKKNLSNFLCNFHSFNIISPSSYIHPTSVWSPRQQCDLFQFIVKIASNNLQKFILSNNFWTPSNFVNDKQTNEQAKKKIVGEWNWVAIFLQQNFIGLIFFFWSGQKGKEISSLNNHKLRVKMLWGMRF